MPDPEAPSLSSLVIVLQFGWKASFQLPPPSPYPGSSSALGLLRSQPHPMSQLGAGARPGSRKDISKGPGWSWGQGPLRAVVQEGVEVGGRPA